MVKRISIVIVNFNVADYIDKLIASIYRHVDNDTFQIIVIDNNSDDKTIEDIREKYPGVKLVLLKQNLGFSGGNNAAAKLAECKYLLFLNPDTLLEEDCINPLINELETNSGIGMITATLLYEDNSFQSSYGNDRGVFIESIDALYLTRVPYLMFKKIGMYVRYKLSKPFYVKWISGAFIIMKKDLFEKVGGFDPAYPLNYEDMDLCKKVLNQGLKIMVHPGYNCIHYESKSQKRNYYNFVFKRYSSKLIYLKKYMSSLQANLIKNIHIIGLYLRLFFLFTIKNETERADRKRAFKDSLKLYFNTDL